MKLDVMRPNVVIDINDLQSRTNGDQFKSAPLQSAWARWLEWPKSSRNTELQTGYPVLAQSLSFAASQQLRNMAIARRQCAATHALHLFPRSELGSV